MKETKRLRLRPISLSDNRAIFEYRSDFDTNKYQGWIPRCLEEVEIFINSTSPAPNISGTWHQLVIIEKETWKIIGDVGLHFLTNEEKKVEIGCTLSKKYQGKGYAMEALTEVISYLFNDLKKQVIVATIDPNNKKSIKMVKMLGFEENSHPLDDRLKTNKDGDEITFTLHKESK